MRSTQLPVNLAGRFSLNARIPSFASRDAKTGPASSSEAIMASASDMHS